MPSATALNNHKNTKQHTCPRKLLLTGEILLDEVGGVLEVRYGAHYGQRYARL